MWPGTAWVSLLLGACRGQSGRLNEETGVFSAEAWGFFCGGGDSRLFWSNCTIIHIRPSSCMLPPVGSVTGPWWPMQGFPVSHSIGVPFLLWASTNLLSVLPDSQPQFTEIPGLSNLSCVSRTSELCFGVFLCVCFFLFVNFRLMSLNLKLLLHMIWLLPSCLS